MDRARLHLLAVVAMGIIINVAMAFIMYMLNIPLYLDVIGTIAVAFLAGSVPALIVAVCSNWCCSFINNMAVFYTVISVIIAVISAAFVRKPGYKKTSRILKFILNIGIISGVISSIIQFLLLGGPQFQTVSDTAELLTSTFYTNFYLNFFVINICLNIVDKGLSAFIVMSLFKLIPHKQKTALWTIGWKQKPLNQDEIKAYMHNNKNSGQLQRKISTILIAAAIAITVVMGFISISLYFEGERKDATESAYGAAKMAAEAIDPKIIIDFKMRGPVAPGYNDTKEDLARIKENIPSVEYLYVLIPEEEGCRVVFDIEDDGNTVYASDIIPYDEAILPYKDALLSGNNIDAIESKDSDGWLSTVYYPVKTQDGRTICYACADVNMSNLSRFVNDYLIRIALIFSGYLATILAGGLWFSRFYLVYPIDSMVSCTNDFMGEAENPTLLQEHIKHLESLKIETGDELENLYHALCKMTSDTAEQMNDLRHQAKAISQMQSGLIITLADMVENRDSDTGYHILKTADYVRIILEGLKAKGYYANRLTDKFITEVEMAAPLHDIGKINIPDAVLNKPGRLTDEEYEIMKGHTTAGKKIMEKAISTFQGENYLKEARNMAAYHHEKWDGTGYPEGLKGEVIPLSARVMAVADVFDALTSKRVYKEAMSYDEAIEIIKFDKGKHFDPMCVEVFVEAEDEVKRVLRKYHED